MTTISATIKNSAGIHVRPSGVIFNHIKDYPGKIEVTVDGQTFELNSVMIFLAMGLEKGKDIKISVTGPNEEDEAKTLKELFEKEYDFPPR